jgi:hypothetical protein
MDAKAWRPESVRLGPEKPKGYEYELCVARLDAGGRAVRVSSINLTTTAAFASGAGFGFCGLGFCSIQAKTEKRKIIP